MARKLFTLRGLATTERGALDKCRPARHKRKDGQDLAPRGRKIGCAASAAPKCDLSSPGSMQLHAPSIGSTYARCTSTTFVQVVVADVRIEVRYPVGDDVRDGWPRRRHTHARTFLRSLPVQHCRRMHPTFFPCLPRRTASTLASASSTAGNRYSGVS
jgi:hypothetical protein